MKVLFLILFVFISFNCNAQSVQKYNLNFELKGAKNHYSKGWSKWGKYNVALDSTVKHSGKYAAKITSDSTGNSFGAAVFKIPINYKGISIKLEGYMKLKRVEDGYAGLFLRIDGTGQTLVFDN